MGSVRGPSNKFHIHLDDALGPQRSSLRQNSARYSFARSGREEKSCQEAPGPGEYDDFVSARKRGSSAVIGSAGTAVHSRPYQEQTPIDDDDAPPPDSGRFRFNAPPRATFGYEERGGKVMDTEFIRACPHHGYGSDGPGFVYSPDESRVRPQSAPSYTIRKRPETNRTQRSSTPSKVAPNSYPGAKEDAIGVQRSSRRRTASASSFGRAERFPAPKPAGGTLTDECVAPRSDFGDPRCGRRGSGAHATFGSTTRAGSARAGISRGAGDRPFSAKARLPHPPVATRQEILRYSDNLHKNA